VKDLATAWENRSPRTGARIWSPVVAGFKATHWPYYEFVQSKPSGESESPSVTALQRSLNQYRSARPLLEGLLSSENPAEDVESVLSLLERAQIEAKKVDRDELNSIAAGFGDAVLDDYLEALEHYTKALAEGGNAIEGSRGDAAMVRFVTWMEENLERLP
jgi:hypothetical protein